VAEALHGVVAPPGGGCCNEHDARYFLWDITAPECEFTLIAAAASGEGWARCTFILFCSHRVVAEAGTTGGMIALGTFALNPAAVVSSRPVLMLSGGPVQWAQWPCATY
jgi:hypothetical protein